MVPLPSWPPPYRPEQADYWERYWTPALIAANRNTYLSWCALYNLCPDCRKQMIGKPRMCARHGEPLSPTFTVKPDIKVPPNIRVHEAGKQVIEAIREYTWMGGHRATQTIRDEPYDQPHRHTQENDILQDCPCYNKEDKMSRKDAVLARMRQLEAELAKLNERPEEPRGSDSRPVAIYFKKQFAGPGASIATEYVPGLKMKTYHYIFIKTAGKWYGTGPKAPKAYTWDELMDWLENTGPFPKKIYVLDKQSEPYWTKRED